MTPPVITGETTIAELERVLREHDLLVEVGQPGFRCDLWTAQALRTHGAYVYDGPRATGRTLADALNAILAQVSR